MSSTSPDIRPLLAPGISRSFKTTRQQVVGQDQAGQGDWGRGVKQGRASPEDVQPEGLAEPQHLRVALEVALSDLVQGEVGVVDHEVKIDDVDDVRLRHGHLGHVLLQDLLVDQDRLAVVAALVPKEGSGDDLEHQVLVDQFAGECDRAGAVLLMR